MVRRLHGCCGFLLLVTTVCGGCAGHGTWALPWSREAAAPDVTQYGSHKASPMQSLAAALTFGRSASKANEEAARKVSSIEATDPLSLQNMPRNIGPDVYIHAAQLYELKNNTALASSNYERALEVDPQNIAALVGYARLNDRQGKFDQAVDLYQRAIQADPQNALLHSDLALCLNRQGQMQLSLQEMQRAIELEPRNPLYRNNIAKMLVQAGREQEAIQQLSAVFPAAAAHYNVGYLLYENQRPDLAQQHFAQALQLQPGFAEASQMLQVVQAVANTGQGLPPHAQRPAAPQPEAGLPENHFSHLPQLPRKEAQTRRSYADEVDEAPMLAPPIVEMPR